MMQDTCGINKEDEWNQLAPVQSSVNSNQYVEIPCYTSLPRDDQAALEFRLDKTDTEIDPSSMFMYFILQLVDENGKAVEGPTEEEIKKFLKDKKTDPKAVLKDDRPSSVNLLAYSLFSSVEVFISDQKINPGSSYYPWMCYVLNLLHQSSDTKNKILKLAGWYPDVGGVFDKVTGEMNTGFTERRGLLSSDNVELLAKVMLDTVFPARVLPVQTEFTLHFNRSNPNFCLLAEKGTFRNQNKVG